MKKILVLLAGSFLLTSCMAMFETNLLKTLDVPPVLNAAEFVGQSSEDLAAKLATDPSFVDSLKESPEALAAVQGILEGTMANGTETERAAAAKSFIFITTNATESGVVANNFVGALMPLLAPGADLSATLNGVAGVQDLANGFFTGLNDTQVKDTLLSMLALSNAMTTLSGATTDSTAFLAGTNSGDVAQVGVTAAAMTMLLESTGEDLTTATGKDAAVATVIALLAADPTTVDLNATFPFLNNNITELNAGINGTAVAGNPYAYLGDIMGALPITL